MVEDLKRPLFFDVQRVQISPIALVNRNEAKKLTQRHANTQREDEDDGEFRVVELPTSALPMIRSPRPVKTVYVPSPTKTPSYFRWKPKAPSGNNILRSSHRPNAPLARIGPHATSPRLNAVILPGRVEGDRWSPQTMDFQNLGPSFFEVQQGTGRGTLEMPVLAPLGPASTALPSTPSSTQSRRASVSIKQADLFGNEDLPTTLITSDTTTSSLDEAAPKADKPLTDSTSSAAATPTLSEPLVVGSTLVEVKPTPAPAESRDVPTPMVSESTPTALTPEDEDTSDDEDLARDQEEEPGSVAIEISGSDGGPARQPQEKSVAQHLLRGKFLRKYLHANNLTRKLKETEQALRSAALMGGVPTLKGGGSLFSRSFITKSESSGTPGQGTVSNAPGTATRTLVQDLLGGEATALLSDHLPVLRRLSSIDKAINNTARRIRRMSGIEDPNNAASTSTKVAASSPPKSTERSSNRKFTPLKAIGEKRSMVFDGLKEEDEPVTDSFDSVDDDFDSSDPAAGLSGTKIDPSSAHMMRICQHVIAKRAIKAFLRQEMSVITVIEVALRDDTHLMPPWLQQAHQSFANSTTMTAHLQQQQQLHSWVSTPDIEGVATTCTHTQQVEAHRVPIKSMQVDILEAVGGYLREGDQHLCLEEVYAYAIQAERDKLWKRAILLASVCVVLDREFLHGVLLRARCCRRLGLWAQAIKDLAHAILLRTDEYKLVLLRACLFVKTGELDAALVDANRALAFFPKSIDALLLRAEIFHRQDAIGASLQDLTTAILFDPSCWRAYYDRATIRIRAIEGDEYSLNYHWEHMKYEKLLASIIEDYVSAVRKGCQMVEVVETIGDLSVRLVEFTGDANVLRQVVSNLTHLLQILAHDHRRSFHSVVNTGPGMNRSPSIANATATVAASVTVSASSASTTNGSATVAGTGLEQLRSTELARELLLASIHAQRGRLFVLLQDRMNALADFDQAVVTEYHYPVAHFYRGAFATLTTKSEDAVAIAATLQHLNRCISLDPTIAGAYTVRGELFLRDLKFNSALQDFKAAVATDPTLYEVWLQIALIYLNHYHDSDACIRACTSALTNDSCLARALYLRAEAFTRQGNLRAALKDYGRLTVAQPDDRWAQLMRGRLLLQMKLARPALYAFIQFMELGAHAREQRHGPGEGCLLVTTADKRGHLLCGRAYKILTRFQLAVDQFQSAVTLNPTSENLVLLSESLHSMGDTENSLRVSEKVINADPSSYKGYVRRAQLLVTTGQFQRALAEYTTALTLAPKEARVYYERGIVQMQLYLRWRVAFQLNFEDKPLMKTSRSPFEPRIPAIEVEATLGTDQINDERTVVQNMKTCYVDAIGDFCKSLRLDPSACEPLVDRAELYLLGEDYGKAFADFHAALERNPKCVRAYVNLGVLKCHFMAFAAAIADFDLAIRHDPRLALAFFNRGVCYQKLELFRHADQSYSKCITLTGIGRDINAHRNRAIVRCHTANAFEDALKDFDEVRQSAPDDDQLHGGLGYVLLQLGRYEEAARCFATYGRLNRDTFADSGNAYFNLASSSSARHLDQTRYDAYLEKALRLYLRAVRLHPSNLDLRLNLANCLRRLREPWKAIAQCDAIHKAKPLHHAGLESKSLCYYQMHRLPEAVEYMNEAIRACVGSSSALQNIFYAFAHTSIHRHALERKTVGEQRAHTSESRSRSAGKSETMHDAMSAQLFELQQKRLVLSSAEPPPAQPVIPTANAIVLTGSSKQLLALYMMNRGILNEKMGAWDDAMRDYKDAVHFDPLSVQPLLCMATLQLLQRQYEESRTVFEMALELEPANGLAHLNLGVVHLCTDDLVLALQHLDAAIEALPTCSYAYANKAVALARQGELQQAETQLKRAIEELPSRKEYYLARGKIIAQQKRLQDAMVDFSTALFLGYEGKL